MLPPIETKGLKVPEDVPALIEKVRNQMTETLKEISQAPPSKKVSPQPPSSPTTLLKESKQKTYKATDPADVTVEPVSEDADSMSANPEKESKLAVA